MKARDLRIGNYVNFNNTHKEQGVVTAISKELGDNLDMVYLNQRIDNYYLMEHIEPIKLTEEWLKKFDYEHLETWEEISNPTEQNEELIKFHDVKKYTHKDCRSIYVIVELNEIYVYITPRDYLGKIPVHRFQNIHLSISGKELTIKDK